MKSGITTRLRSIDALRGIAALGVVFYHAVDQTDKVVPAGVMKYPVRGLQYLSSLGYIGVFLFFVISGFCIHLQWARAKASNEQPKIVFGQFWKRRLRRLYPPYIIAIALFLLITAASAGLNVTRFFVYDVVMHLLMLHNLDPKTCYSINGVFWTLAIEEQLYLAYFLLLFLRKRLGWTLTLTICLSARLGWMVFSHVVWLKSGGIGVPVPEAAASHWFTWALGAIAVEAWFGMVRLPKWTSNLKLGAVLVVAASILSNQLPHISKETYWHDFGWFVLHPIWGVGFFIVVNRTVLAEDSWTRSLKLPSLISVFATLGVFSYSIYLTHELTIMQSWRWIDPQLAQSLNVLAITIPATILIAWIFFWFCERPFMVKKRGVSTLEHGSDQSPLHVSIEPQMSVATD